MARATASLLMCAVLLSSIRSVYPAPNDEAPGGSQDDPAATAATLSGSDVADTLAPAPEETEDTEADAEPGAELDAEVPVVASGGGRCHGRFCFDADDVRAALRTVGPQTRCVAEREMGPSLSPNSYGSQGEVGPIQLHPRGKLPEFLRTGLDPWSPYDTLPWLQAQLRAGQGNHWSPVRLGLC